MEQELEQEQGGGEPVDVHAEAGEGRAAGGANHGGQRGPRRRRRDQHAGGRKEGCMGGGARARGRVSGGPVGAPERGAR